MSRLVFLDTETTGLSPEGGDRVIEIGCVEMVNRRLTGRHFHHYLNPERPSSEEAVKVHGLTDAFLADKPLFASVVDEFVDYMAGAEVVIHNAAFDMNFLNHELKRLGRPALNSVVSKVTDTLLMAREMFPGKKNSLDALCQRLEVDNTHRTLHGALMDAELLAEVFVRMTRGQNALAMDAMQDPSSDRLASVARVDLRSMPLIELPAHDDERAAHEGVLKEIDKSSGGTTLWRKLVS